VVPSGVSWCPQAYDGTQAFRRPWLGPRQRANCFEVESHLLGTRSGEDEVCGAVGLGSGPHPTTHLIDERLPFVQEHPCNLLGTRAPADLAQRPGDLWVGDGRHH